MAIIPRAEMLLAVKIPRLSADEVLKYLERNEMLAFGSVLKNLHHTHCILHNMDMKVQNSKCDADTLYLNIYNSNTV